MTSGTVSRRDRGRIGAGPAHGDGVTETLPPPAGTQAGPLLGRRGLRFLSDVKVTEGLAGPAKGGSPVRGPAFRADGVTRAAEFVH